MDSKYNMMGNRPQIPKFQLKIKQKPNVFNNNSNVPSPPKKIKFSNENAQNKPMKPANLQLSKKESIIEHKKRLPVYQKRHKLLELIKRYSTLIILGETGSGKTTQVPQFIYSARLQNEGKIAITQPRRVAAISISLRVAQEMSSEIGDTVGYSVRFEDVTTKKTKIKYLTDGMLLREAMVDRLLMDYNVIILDEAHERTIHTDVLFGIVKEAQKIRLERNISLLKIIVMSATMDVDHFSEYFNKCQAVYLEGRTFSVNVLNSVQSHDDYQFAAIATLFQIHREAPVNHDVLIFLTGQEEIEAMAHQIRTLSRDPDCDGPGIRVCTLYAAQPTTAQLQVFHSTPANVRKVILSTNIAETSLTIPGIKFVIDTGMVKIRTYHPATGLDLLKVQRTSQEQAWQRTGRAGRDADGQCYRLYTRAQYELMQKTTVPEIQRANLASVCLQLLTLKVHALHFDFMDKPPKDSILVAFEQLKMLKAIDSVHNSELTALGRKMSQFPLDPRFSKILLSATEFGCLEEVLTVIAIAASESIFTNPQSKMEEAQRARLKFVSPCGDHMTNLNAYREFQECTQNKRAWCMEHFMNLRNLTYVQEVRKQLLEICLRVGIPLSSCGTNYEQLRKCLITGLFMNLAELHRDRQYITLDKRQVVYIHPSSVLHDKKPELILFTEVVHTSKCYLRNLSVVESEWLHQIAPEYSRSHNVRVNSDKL